MQSMEMESILVLEDSMDSRKMFCLLPRKVGYDVQSAANADETLDILKHFHPDLNLMDILLPGSDGLSFARALSTSAGMIAPMIVVLSACSLSSDVQGALASGCSGFITKPIDRKTFVSVVRSHLSRRTTRWPRELETPIGHDTSQAGTETPERSELCITRIDPLKTSSPEVNRPS